MQKKEVGGNGSNQHSSKYENFSELQTDKKSNTSAKLGNEFGVTGRTVENDHKLYQAYNKLKDEGVPEEDILKMFKHIHTFI